MSREQSSQSTGRWELPSETLDAIPDHAPESVRDIQYLYGQLYVAYQRETFGADENTVYLTPDEASDAIGTPDSLVSVDIDVTGSAPSYEGVTVTSYDRDLVDAVAHSKYYARRGMDFSITHETGGTTAVATVGKYAAERVSKWPVDEAVVEATSDHPDYWVIEALQEIGSDDDVVEQVKNDVEEALSGKQRRLVTVRLRGADGNDEWQYPGNVPVLTQGMVARRKKKLYDKGDADNARGEGTCYVTGGTDTVYGVAADPLKWYLTKQRESFDGLNANDSWRTQPLSADAALYAEKSEPFLDACRYTSAGASFYVLPYFPGEQTEAKIQWLYRVLCEQLQEVQEMEASDSDDGMRRPEHIEKMYEDLPEDMRSELKMHVLGMDRYQADKYRVVYTAFGADVLSSVAVAEAHKEALQRTKTRDWLPWVTTGDGGPLDPERPTSNYLSLVTSPWYFMQTMPGTDADEPGVDEPYFEANRRLLSGRPIAIEHLLDAYTERLLDRWDPGADGTDGVPAWTASLQYTQLVALSEAGLLTSNRTTGESRIKYFDPEATGEETFQEMTDNTEDDGEVTSSERRQATYDAFFESHEMLRDDPERRAAFTFGALVGEVSRYQKAQETNPVAKDMTADTITKRNLSQRITDVVDLVQVYSETADVEVTGTMYSTLTDQLTDDLHHTPPEQWDLSLNDLRFHYSLGVTYGLNNYTENGDSDDAGAGDE